MIIRNQNMVKKVIELAIDELGKKIHELLTVT